ncbi:MAG: VanZ family protein [Atopobiaceae bacterium]|nr:VanZ family protein [Atopobiaceae bacterium]
MNVLSLIRLLGRFASRLGWRWWFVSAIVGIICAVACHTMRRHERFFAADTVSSALLGWYLTLIAAFTIFARRPRDVGQRFNLDVFNTIAERLTPGRGSEYEVILNFVMLVPLGMLLPCIKDCGFKHVAIAALCLATIIESLQLILSVGTFELVDVVENTSGAILGYSFYALLHRLRVCQEPRHKAPEHLA